MPGLGPTGEGPVASFRISKHLLPLAGMNIFTNTLAERNSKGAQENKQKYCYSPNVFYIRDTCNFQEQKELKIEKHRGGKRP